MTDQTSANDDPDLSGLKGYYVKKLGQNRGAPRVWLQGSQALLAGFTPGQRYDIRIQDMTVVLQANPDGSRVVSTKRIGERDNPVIDINSRELLAVFDGMAAVRVAVKDGQIALLPLASEIKKQRRFNRIKEKLESGEPLSMGSLFHGIGVMSHAIHAGLEQAGVSARLAMVSEIEEHLVEHAREHNDAWTPTTRPYSASISELAFDERALASLPKVDILEAGVPCVSSSKAGRASRGLIHPEAHPDVGHLVVATLVIIGRTEPAVVVFENVPDYAHTTSADILRLQLRDLGYVTHERVLRGTDWNTLEGRSRWCMCAVTSGIEFDFEQLVPPPRRDRTLAEALDPIAEDDPSWSRMDGLKAKMVTDRAKGSNFKMQVFGPNDPNIGTITKGYSKVRSSDPKIQHPTNPDLLRQLTPAEHARVKGIPSHLVDGLSATVAHEGMGQSIVYPPFKDVGQQVGNVLNRIIGKAPVPFERGDAGDEVWESNGGPVPDAISELVADVVLTLKMADTARGEYEGNIIMLDNRMVIQDCGSSVGIVHLVSNLNGAPLRLGSVLEARYHDGRASCSIAAVEATPGQLGLFDGDPKLQTFVEVSKGAHFGPVVAVQEKLVIQDSGRGKLVAHALSGFDRVPRIGDRLDVAYRNDAMVVKNRSLDPQRDGVSR